MKHLINAEVLLRSELLLLRHLVQHARAHRRRVRAQEILLRFLYLPLVSVTLVIYMSVT